MNRRRATVLFVTLATLWGLSFPAIAVGLESLPPLLFAAFRYDVAAVLLLAYVAVAREEWLPTASNDLVAVAGGGIFLVAGNGLLFLGQQTVPSGVAAILQSLVPIITALWAFGLLGERLSRLGAAGTALGLVGVAFIIRPDPANLLAGDTVARLLVLGQVASVALGGVIVQRAAPTINRPSMTAWAMALGAVVLHVVSVVAGESLAGATFDATAIGAVVYLGVFSTAVAFLIYFTLLAERGAFEASLVAYLVPVVATIVGVVVLNEEIGLLTYVGFLTVAAGFALLKRDALVEIVRVS